MTDPRYVIMSYSSGLKYPQTRAGIYLNFNDQIPIWVNYNPKPICHTESFSESMLACKIHMKKRGKITKLHGCACIDGKCRNKHGKVCR